MKSPTVAAYSNSADSPLRVVAVGTPAKPMRIAKKGGRVYALVSMGKVHAAFVSCIGIDVERGAREGFEEQASYKERLTILAEKVILLVDSSKFESRSEYFFAATQDIDHIVCDHCISSKFEQKIRSMGIKLTIAEPA